MSELLQKAKEVREITDDAEAAALVNTGDWVIVKAIEKSGGWLWVLIRI